MTQAVRYIYAIGAITPYAPIKIGFSGEPPVRLLTLQKKAPEALHVLYQAPVRKRLARKAEALAHAKLRDRSLGGEWFSVDAATAIEAIDLSIIKAGKPERVQPPMTPRQYRSSIKCLGLTQRAAGKFLAVNERQSRRWAAGDARIPKYIGMLLRLMICRKLTPKDVDAITEKLSPEDVK